MKNAALFSTALLLFTINLFAQDSNADIVRSFLSNVPSATTEKISAANPVASVSGIAQKHAAKTIVLTKENIVAALSEAKKYKTGIVVVGGHTFARVNDFSKCSVSNSWGTCMPYAEGYIKKGALVSTSGPLNNIIGRPDDQVRTLYLFN